MIILPDKPIIAARTMLGWRPPYGFDKRLEHCHVAIVALTMADAVIPQVVEGVTEYVLTCIQPDGGLNDGTWAGSEMECAYSAIRALQMCGTWERYPEPDRLLEWVLSKQNEDGGFGALCDWGQIYEHADELRKGNYSVLGFYEESSAHSCYFAYGALAALGATQRADLKKLEDYILSVQMDDGGWAFYPTNEHGSTITTAMALTVLDKLDALSRVDRRKTVDWLLSCQRSDGGFDAYPGHNTDHITWLYSARASKALRILGAFHEMNVYRFEEYWNKHSEAAGWNVISLGMAAGHPLVLAER